MYSCLSLNVTVNFQTKSMFERIVCNHEYIITCRWQCHQIDFLVWILFNDMNNYSPFAIFGTTWNGSWWCVCVVNYFVESTRVQKKNLQVYQAHTLPTTKQTWVANEMCGMYVCMYSKFKCLIVKAVKWYKSIFACENVWCDRNGRWEFWFDRKNGDFLINESCSEMHFIQCSMFL